MKKLVLTVAMGIFAIAGFAGVNENEVLRQFVQEQQEEAAKEAAGQAEVLVEQTPFGDMIVMAMHLPISAEQLKQVPVDMMKPEMIKQTKSEIPAEVISEMAKERANFIYRLISTDGNSVDIFITPADLK